MAARAGWVPYDNIIFGEPALVLGVVLLVVSFGLWRRGDLIAAPGPGRDEALGALGLPMSVLAVGIGLGCFAIAAATVGGVAWTLAGLAFLLFGALNCYTHIELILATQPSAG
ncbi:hypothetical protein [Aquipuribacter nitratireducens]|uniref:Uncharacterized protein n=1 Tax=Aquipuribacter nitratireducens TaxID=650104 RepID=A0ABW0GH68_9MICO